jgi:pimeloyl-ACP methyl ester carboxylesterase
MSTVFWTIARQRVGLLVCAGLLSTVPGRAQEPLPRGELVSRVVVEGDTAQTYALYLPGEYHDGRTWPLLILMDARGRALVPLPLVAAVADRLGFLVVSSYNTVSDGPVEPNVEALNALLRDVPSRWAVDPERVYLAGFSGTARFAWEAAERLPGNVPGVVGVGAGPLVNDPQRMVLLTLQGVPFDYFGAVGNLDFNFHEVLALESRLDDRSIPNRFEVFDGPHAWPPEEVMDRAVTWLELRAVIRGLAERPSSWIDSVYAAWYEKASELESAGRAHDAWRAYRSLARDFEDLTATDSARARAAALDRSSEVRRVREVLERSERRLVGWDEHYREVSRALRDGADLALHELLERLEVPAFQQGAASTEDAEEARSYQRILELAFARTSFYEPRQYLAEGDPERALLMAEVAATIKPEDPGTCLILAGLHAHLGRSDEALEWVGCYARSPTASAAVLESDPLLTPLRADRRFRGILARLGGSGL